MTDLQFLAIYLLGSAIYFTQRVAHRDDKDPQWLVPVGVFLVACFIAGRSMAS